MPIKITATEHRYTMDLNGYDGLAPIDRATQRWIKATAATVVLDATGTPQEVTLTGEAVTTRSEWTQPAERQRTGEQATLTLDAAALRDYDRIPGIVRIAIQEAAGRLGSRNDPAALLGHCPTFLYGKASHIVQPASKGGERGTVFRHRPDDAPPSWYAARDVRREDGQVIVKTTCGHTVTFGEKEFVDYAF